MFLMGPLDGVPTVSETSLNLTPSPLGDLTEFLFPAAEESRMISWDLEESLRSDMMLMPLDSIHVNNVEFGEVFTDIDDLLNMNVVESATYQQVKSEDTCDVLPVMVSNDDVTVPESVEFYTISLPEEQPSTSNYGEPDHNYSTVKKRKRKISEISECSESLIYSGDDKKFTKYLERRRKNNIASKRSRETRKTKFLSMDDEADELERSNAELRQKIEQLESLTKRMKEALVAKLSSAN